MNEEEKESARRQFFIPVHIFTPHFINQVRSFYAQLNIETKITVAIEFCSPEVKSETGMTLVIVGDHSPRELVERVSTLKNDQCDKELIIEMDDGSVSIIETKDIQ